MTLDFFKTINEQLKPVTSELAYHIVGDPLVLSNLKSYLDISYENRLKVNITTTANHLNQSHFKTLQHPTLKQVNFSINSYNANSHKKSMDEYLNPIFDYCVDANSNKNDFFINLRIWNLDDSQSARAFNEAVFEKAKEYFGVIIDTNEVYKTRPKNIRLGRKLFFNFDDYFEWPSLSNEFVSDKGFCYGLDSHFGILASGEVVPCCLDKDACIQLGNLHQKSVDEILNSSRARLMHQGFKNHEVIEELCQKCSYRTRFDKV